MPHTSTLPAAILETVLTAIPTLFLAGASNDAALARLAAKELLADYNPKTADELSLAATIISCSFRALDILVQATAKDLPTPQMLRLHASANSRRSRKSARKPAPPSRPKSSPIPNQRRSQPDNPQPVRQAQSPSSPRTGA